MEKVKIVLYGVGAVGSLIAKYLLQKEGVKIVGAVDIAEEKVGKDLDDVLGLNRKLVSTSARSYGNGKESAMNAQAANPSRLKADQSNTLQPFKLSPSF